jgi:hypothetical protein
MPNRYQTGNGNAELSANMFLAPALAASMWNPFLALREMPKHRKAWAHSLASGKDL